MRARPPSVVLSVSMWLSGSLNLHVPLSDVFQVSFSSPLSLSIAGQMEPKILRLVESQTPDSQRLFLQMFLFALIQ